MRSTMVNGDRQEYVCTTTMPKMMRRRRRGDRRFPRRRLYAVRGESFALGVSAVTSSMRLLVGVSIATSHSRYIEI
jgi:hypothetical protein